MEQTLAIIKPDGVKRRLVGECIGRFENKGLIITAIKSGKISVAKANILYNHIKQKYPKVFKSLISFMTDNPVVFMVIEGKGVVKKVRKICGPTDPATAPKGTIRGDFGRGNMKILTARGETLKNIIHASGSLEEAKKEIKLFF